MTVDNSDGDISASPNPPELRSTTAGDVVTDESVEDQIGQDRELSAFDLGHQTKLGLGLKTLMDGSS